MRGATALIRVVLQVKLIERLPLPRLPSTAVKIACFQTTRFIPRAAIQTRIAQWTAAALGLPGRSLAAQAAVAVFTNEPMAFTPPPHLVVTNATTLMARWMTHRPAAHSPAQSTVQAAGMNGNRAPWTVAEVAHRLERLASPCHQHMAASRARQIKHGSARTSRPTVPSTASARGANTATAVPRATVEQKPRLSSSRRRQCTMALSVTKTT